MKFQKKSRKQNNTYEYQVVRALKRKVYLLSLRGNKCEKCGYNKNLSAFEFHHKNPSEKLFQLDQRSLGNHSMKSVLKEFDKCQILCSNCHREHHSPELDFNMVLERIINISNDHIKVKNKKDLNKCVECNSVISKWGKRCRTCDQKSRRKVERPDTESLKESVKKYGYSKVGRDYNVTGKTIKKWIKNDI